MKNDLTHFCHTFLHFIGLPSPTPHARLPGYSRRALRQVAAGLTVRQFMIGVRKLAPVRAVLLDPLGSRGAAGRARHARQTRNCPGIK